MNDTYNAAVFRPVKEQTLKFQQNETFTTAILMDTPKGHQPALCLMASAVPLFFIGDRSSKSNT